MFGLNLVVIEVKLFLFVIPLYMNTQTAEQLAEIAKSAARVVRLFGFDPKVAFVISFNFWSTSYR